MYDNKTSRAIKFAFGKYLPLALVFLSVTLLVALCSQPAKAHHKECVNTISKSIITREKAKVAAPEQHHYVTPARIELFGLVFTEATGAPWSDEQETALYVMPLNDGALLIAFHEDCLLGYLKIGTQLWTPMAMKLESI